LIAEVFEICGGKEMIFNTNQVDLIGILVKLLKNFGSSPFLDFEFSEGSLKVALLHII